MRREILRIKEGRWRTGQTKEKDEEITKQRKRRKQKTKIKQKRQNSE